MRIFAALFCVTFAACTNPIPSLSLDAVALSPDRGPIGGGNAVTITGTGLTNTHLVVFGNTASPSVVIVSDTTITAVAPPGTGSVPVLVYDAHFAGQSLAYSYGSPPLLDDLTPTHGAAGTSVRLFGSGLTGATQVLFGGVEAASFTVTSDKQVVAVAPAGTGAENVSVVTRFGTSNGVGFGYDLGAPTLTTITPSMGPEAGGTTVTVSGTGFVPGTTLTIGGNAATDAPP